MEDLKLWICFGKGRGRRAPCCGIAVMSRFWLLKTVNYGHNFFLIFSRTSHTCGWQSAFLVNNFLFITAQSQVFITQLFGPWYFKYTFVGNKEWKNWTLSTHFFNMQFKILCSASIKQTCWIAFLKLSLKKIHNLSLNWLKSLKLQTHNTKHEMGKLFIQIEKMIICFNILSKGKFYHHSSAEVWYNSKLLMELQNNCADLGSISTLVV